MDNSTKRIAFCGTRGIPANYGGFETAVEEISKRFVKKGYKCDVFCRENSYKERVQQYNGCDLIYIEGSKSRKLDTIVSSIKTGMYLLKNRKNYKSIFWFNNANLPGIIISLLTGIDVYVNTDGLEWRRAKWSLPFKVYYFLSSFVITVFCKNLISDSISIQDYYKSVFKKKTQFIPYGSADSVELNENEENQVLNSHNIQKDKYFLQITRFEPDNLPLKILSAFKKSTLPGKGYKMVLVGYKEETLYSVQIKELNNKDGIVVLNAIYDHKTLAILRKNAFSYVHGNSVGGTNPALLEAMTQSKRILAIDSPFSKEVLGNLGTLFDKNDIVSEFNSIITSPSQKKELLDRVKTKYDWDRVADSYENLILGRESNYQTNYSYGSPILGKEIN